MVDLTNAPWRKSSRSGSNGGACVEAAGVHGVVAVRDSKNPEGSKLVLSSTAFGSFTTALKHH